MLPESEPINEPILDLELWQATQRLGQLVAAAVMRPTLYIGTAFWAQASQQIDVPVPAKYATSAWRINELHNVHQQVAGGRPRLMPRIIEGWPELVIEGMFLAKDPFVSLWRLGAYRLSPEYVGGLIPLRQGSDPLTNCDTAQLWLLSQAMPRVLASSFPRGRLDVQKALTTFAKRYKLPL